MSFGEEIASVFACGQLGISGSVKSIAGQPLLLDPEGRSFSFGLPFLCHSRLGGVGKRGLDTPMCIKNTLVNESVTSGYLNMT